MMRLFTYIGVQKEDRRIILTMYLAFFTSGMVNVVMGLLIPILTMEHDLLLVQSGLMLSAHEAGNLGAVLLAGFLPTRIGRKQTALVLTAGLSAGMVLLSFAQSYIWLMAAYTLAGVARGAIGNLCNSVVAEKSTNKAAALNVLHALFAVGALLIPIVLWALTFRNTTLWRSGTWVIAILGLALWGNLYVSKFRENVAVSPGGKQETAFLVSISFWISTGMLFFYICAESTIIGWFVMYFENAGVLSARLAGLVPLLLWAMILVGRMFCAYVSPIFGSHRLLLVIGLVFLGFFALLAKTTALCMVALLGIGVSMAGIYPTTISTLKQASAAATGTCIAIASIGGVIMPGIVGYIANTLGLTAGMASVLVALVCMVLCMLANLHMYKRKGALETNASE